jgi:hypothetical protein
MAISTYEKWFNPGTQLGLSTTIMAESTSTKRSVEMSINRQLGAGSARDMAKMMLDDSREFVYELVQFVNEFYAEMSQAPSMSLAEAWLLTRNLLQEILMEIRDTRNEVMHSRGNEPLLHIWGALKAHVVMTRYRSKGIRNDPSLSAILVRFILKRKTDLEGMEAIGGKIKSLESKARVLEVELKRKVDK